MLPWGDQRRVRTPIRLRKKECEDLIEFVRDGLFDRRLLQYCKDIPGSVPSGMPLTALRGLRVTLPTMRPASQEAKGGPSESLGRPDTYPKGLALRMKPRGL